jgi:hypothetical protein
MEAFYVGKGKRSRAYSLKRRNPHHANIVKKYGAENIVVDFVPCESDVAAFALEIEWIKTLRLFGAKLCNKTYGGEGLSNPTEETRAKMSASHKGVKLGEGHRLALQNAHAKRKGIRRPPDVCAKISTSKLGKPRPDMAGKNNPAKRDLVREKLSISMKGNDNALGCRRSPETLAKMSFAQKQSRAKRKEMK